MRFMQFLLDDAHTQSLSQQPLSDILDISHFTKVSRHCLFSLKMLLFFIYFISRWRWWSFFFRGFYRRWLTDEIRLRYTYASPKCHLYLTFVSHAAARRFTLLSSPAFLAVFIYHDTLSFLTGYFTIHSLSRRFYSRYAALYLSLSILQSRRLISTAKPMDEEWFQIHDIVSPLSPARSSFLQQDTETGGYAFPHGTRLPLSLSCRDWATYRRADTASCSSSPSILILKVMHATWGRVTLGYCLGWAMISISFII